MSSDNELSSSKLYEEAYDLMLNDQFDQALEVRVYFNVLPLEIRFDSIRRILPIDLLIGDREMRQERQEHIVQLLHRTIAGLLEAQQEPGGTDRCRSRVRSK
jgi:hypothetical protein